MNVLIACDKFKGSLTSQQANEIVRRSLASFFPACQPTLMVASDGGEGFLNAISQLLESSGISAASIAQVVVPTLDPLGRTVTGRYLFDQQSLTAYVELAEASGLGRLQRSEYDPGRTSTRGTGLLIRDAIERGSTTIVLGIGGSATNDGGAGIAAALGFEFVGNDGQTVAPTGNNLDAIARVRLPSETEWRSKLRSTRFVTVNDVENPLLGPTGAAQVYAGQKGADGDTILQLDQAMEQFGSTLTRDLNLDPCLANEPGTGAAGGVGFGMKAFLDTEFAAASEWMLDRLPGSDRFDFVFTGEGKLDRQSTYGKWVCQLARHWSDSATTIVAVCGVCQLDDATAMELGLDQVLQLHDPTSSSLADTIENAATLLADRIDGWCQRQIANPPA
jgi:glycerate kinase